MPKASFILMGLDNKAMPDLAKNYTGCCPGNYWHKTKTIEN
jgi:hypothetical protein